MTMYLIECWNYIANPLYRKTDLLPPSELGIGIVPKTYSLQPGAAYCRIFWK